MPQNLEPLLPDLRVARIEQALRIRNPGLPLTATFLTYYQEEEVVIRDEGEVTVPPQAVFTILIPNPRHPQFDKLFTGRVPFRSWQQENFDVRHDTEPIVDPAFHIFARMVPDAIRWYTNTIELAPLPKDWNPRVVN